MTVMTRQHTTTSPSTGRSHVETLEEIARRLTSVHASLAVRTEIGMNEQIWFDKKLTETLAYVNEAIDREQAASSCRSVGGQRRSNLLEGWAQRGNNVQHDRPL